MIDFAVIPNEAIGPARLGMTRTEIREIFGEPSAVQAAHEKWGIRFPDRDYFHNNAFQVSYDAEFRADFIEASADPAYKVLFNRVAVHDSPPSAVVAIISAVADVDTTESEYPLNLWFPKLHLSLYREHSEHDNFDTIGISRGDSSV